MKPEKIMLWYYIFKAIWIHPVFAFAAVGLYTLIRPVTGDALGVVVSIVVTFFCEYKAIEYLMDQ